MHRTEDTGLLRKVEAGMHRKEDAGMHRREDASMRRSEKEIKDFDEIIEIIGRCDVCRLALFNDEYPYIVPVSFGIMFENEHLHIIFHSSHQGKKIELLKRDNRVAFEMDNSGSVLIGESGCDSTMQYQSVCGNGLVYVVPELEKPAALAAIMDHYAAGRSFEFSEAAIANTAVLRLTVSSLTAKQSPGKQA